MYVCDEFSQYIRYHIDIIKKNNDKFQKKINVLRFITVTVRESKTHINNSMNYRKQQCVCGMFTCVQVQMCVYGGQESTSGVVCQKSSLPV